jgi:hypothetical protein
VKSFSEVLCQLVWSSFQRGLKYDDEWPEEHFFKTLVDDGFRGGHPRAQKVLDRLRSNGRFSLEFDLVRHNPVSMEPLTGADLAVLVELRADKKTVSRRMFLVQLKKAVHVSNGVVRFPELHHHSGKKWYKQPLHQAERMLFFTQCSVFWLAVPPTATADQSFFRQYNSRTNFRELSRRRRIDVPATSASSGFGQFPMVPFGHPRFFKDWDFFFHEFVGRSISQAQVRQWFEQSQQEERDRAVRMLWADLAHESQKLHGMRSRTPVLVSHAESVLGWGAENVTDLKSAFGPSVSLPEFLLGDVLSDGFGDDDEELIDALLKPRPNDFLKRIASEFLHPEFLEVVGDQQPTRAVVRLNVNVNTLNEPQG